VNALYFVARNDRTHEFNETLAAHQHAVNRYQRGRGEARAGAP
jgi:cell division protein YceG involved in septum cleavage